MPKMRNSILSLTLALATAASVEAQVLKNGDFAKGKAFWEGGGGKVIYLDDAGEPTNDKEKGQPVLEVNLSKTNLIEIRQRFTLAHGQKSMKATVIAKASADYVRNDKAQKWTPNNTWEPGGWWVWSALVYPKVDFCMRVDANTHYYLPRSLKAGGAWQTLSGEFKDMNNQGSKVFNIVLPAGDGTIWIKSITTTAK